MIAGGICAFSGQRILLLQGPVGPFFARLTADLRACGAEVHKVNFNAGDWFFYHAGAVNYRGRMEDWPAWLAAHIKALGIDLVLLFGDCRPIHQQARDVAARLGVEIGVFEEGYVRPDFVTLEQFGVNGYSRLSRTADTLGGESGDIHIHHVGYTYWHMAFYAATYFLLAWLGQMLFPHYRHHRPVSASALWPWVRSAARKLRFKWTERHMQRRLTQTLSGRYYLAPLQVFDDAQVVVHASVDGIEGFIGAIIESFARQAPQDTFLVIKHHPMDRGHREYTALISRLARQHGVGERVSYIHDQHLPTLLDHARGVVVINSTTGISALHHGRPTFVYGNALYDLPGLTYQGDLDAFWGAALSAAPEPARVSRFLRHLIAQTQINGSFYKRIPGALSVSGLVWPQHPPAWLDTAPGAADGDAVPAPGVTPPGLTAQA